MFHVNWKGSIRIIGQSLSFMKFRQLTGSLIEHEPKHDRLKAHINGANDCKEVIPPEPFLHNTQIDAERGDEENDQGECDDGDCWSLCKAESSMTRSG
jgi:hypothetical protein